MFSKRSILVLFGALAGATILFLFYDADETRKGDIADVLRKRPGAWGGSKRQSPRPQLISNITAQSLFGVNITNSSINKSTQVIDTELHNISRGNAGAAGSTGHAFVDNSALRAEVTKKKEEAGVANTSTISHWNESDIPRAVQNATGRSKIVNSTSTSLPAREENMKEEAPSQNKSLLPTWKPPPINESDPLPPWTTLPRTQFTEHVVGMIPNLKPELAAELCGQDYKLVVNTSDGIPIVQCNTDRAGDWIWCNTLTRLFASQPIPYNVSIGFLLNDFFEPEKFHNACIASSSRGGKFVMPNMEDIQKMDYTKGFKSIRPDLYSFGHRDDIPWEERNPIPVFRGKAWGPAPQTRTTCGKEHINFTIQDFADHYPARFRAVIFSMDHPTMLNARFSNVDWLLDECFANNATNGLSKVLPLNIIPNPDYFSQFQVALVLKGIGAAFRLSLHLRARTAVIFQEKSRYEEWFTRYLQPNVHYIPLAEDLSNLNETLIWVKDHPAEVKIIGENGRAFFDEYLSFFRNDDHIYELVYRLSEFNRYMAASSAEETNSMILVEIQAAPNTPVKHMFDPKAEYNPKEPLPLWSSSLPRTRFTDHVLDVIASLTTEIRCPMNYDLVVNVTQSFPTVRCNSSLPNDITWCATLQRIFASRALPHNVSLGFILSDSFKPEDVKNACIGSSSPGGKLCMPNMEELTKMRMAAGNIITAPDRYRHPYRDDTPWEERNSVPVFRGTAWHHENNHRSCVKDIDTFGYQEFLKVYPARFRAVDFSADRPDLLDAKFSSINWLLKDCFEQNTTNGFAKLLPISTIATEAYFSNYQVALVLKGIGAAFRLSVHFMTRTAVILQVIDVQEWFAPFLVPYVHYIPLREDLTGLKEVLLWVKGHPKEVRQIGENGRAFYEEYLTFFKNDEHIYEFVYRLSEYRKHIEISR